MRARTDRLSVGVVVGLMVSLLTIAGALISLGIAWGQRSRQIDDQARDLQRIEQIISVTHPEAAQAFGINRKED